MPTPPEPALAAEARRELLENILPFWRRHTVDQAHGGFIAQLSNDLQLQPDAPKGLILNARILWTFSAAYRYTHEPQDQSLAERAYDYLTRRFLDPQHGGFVWALDQQGHILDDKKKIYGQAFCLYALAEYHRTFDASQALNQAIELFHRIETHSRDQAYGGYVETLTRNWQPCDDLRLGDQDMNEKKSMNNHLHLLEAYASLWRAWPDPQLGSRLRQLIDLFQQHILHANPTHLNHFFDERWTPKSDSYTFGHDIEGSWLLWEAAEALHDPPLMAQVQPLALNLARAALNEGLDADGGVFYEGRAGQIINPNKEWWPQAEAVVGFYNAWQLTGETAYREAAARCWRFIQEHIVDPIHGEWFWRVSRDGTPDPALPKVSAWKCPYHNSRCCLEIIRRTERRTSNIER